MSTTPNRSIDETSGYKKATWQRVRYYNDLLYLPCADYLILPIAEDGVCSSVAVANLDETGEIKRILTCDELWQKEDLRGYSRIGRILADVDEHDEGICFDITCGAVSNGLLKSAYGDDYGSMLLMASDVRADSPLSWAFEVNVRRMISAAPWHDPARHDFLGSLFGYLYAKAMELEYVVLHPEEALVCRYRVEDIRNGLIHSGLDDTRQRSLEEGLDYGRRLYSWFLGHQEPGWNYDNRELYYHPNLCAGLMAAQSIGRLNSRRGLMWEDD